MDKVCENREPIIITRQRGEPVVIMSLEDYESLDETAYLMRSPANARRLDEAIQRLNAADFEAVFADLEAIKALGDSPDNDAA